MRITQSMLSNNSLRHLSQSYQRMQTYQEQLTTGKKITRPSQDPVVAMKGMRYRTEVLETMQYSERNINQVYSWVENSDSTLDKVGDAMKRVRELTVQASNDTYDASQRKAISDEINQIIEHIGTLANTKVNEQYIFNGTDTITQPVNTAKLDIDPATVNVQDGNHLFTYDGKAYTWQTDGFVNGTDKYIVNADGRFEHETTGTVLPADDVVVMEAAALPSNSESINIEVMKGITIGVNVNPTDTFNAAFFGDMKTLAKKMAGGASGEELSAFLSKVDQYADQFISKRSELGAKYNRVEMIDSRLSEQEIIAKKIMSENEDVDAERVIIDMLAEETLLRATLGTSARIIQPTLMDFLR